MLVYQCTGKEYIWACINPPDKNNPCTFKIKNPELGRKSKTLHLQNVLLPRRETLLLSKSYHSGGECTAKVKQTNKKAPQLSIMPFKLKQTAPGLAAIFQVRKIFPTPSPSPLRLRTSFPAAGSSESSLFHRSFGLKP